MRPDLHGADAAVEEAGNILVWQILKTVQGEHLALLERSCASAVRMSARSSLVAARSAACGVWSGKSCRSAGSLGVAVFAALRK